MKRGRAKSERSSLMNVGRRVDYAVRALSFLAGQPAGPIVSRTEIEKSQDIPSFYLSKIMKDLVAGGLVHSHIGSKGGFTLAKIAGAITIKDIYETVERPLVLMECLETGCELLFLLRRLHAKIDLGRGAIGARQFSRRRDHRRYRRPPGLERAHAQSAMQKAV